MNWHQPSMERMKHWAVHRLALASHYMGDIQIQIASAMLVAQPVNGLTNGNLYTLLCSKTPCASPSECHESCILFKRTRGWLDELWPHDHAVALWTHSTSRGVEVQTSLTAGATMTFCVVRECFILSALSFCWTLLPYVRHTTSGTRCAPLLRLVPSEQVFNTFLIPGTWSFYIKG